MIGRVMVNSGVRSMPGSFELINPLWAQSVSSTIAAKPDFLSQAGSNNI